MLDGYDERLTSAAPGFVWLVARLLNMFGAQVIQTPETVLGRPPRVRASIEQ